MKKLLLAISICATAVAYAQDNAAVAAPQNTGAAATQQAATVQAQEKSAESLADLNFGAKALDRFSAAVSVAYESEYNFRCPIFARLCYRKIFGTTFCPARASPPTRVLRI